MKRYVFLDRDGTLVQDEGYNNHRSVILLPHTVPALELLRDLGFSFIIVTNQSGIGRGTVDEFNVLMQNQQLASMLAERGIVIEQTLYCPHAPAESCECRKPKPGMLLQVEADLPNSWMIGDKTSDVECGERASCQTLQVSSDFTLLDAAHVIYKLLTARSDEH